ncbi:MAG: apolipoprotein N-acyltransferase [Alphaproteobacteria bacterium]|nr:apolipoprotein N-acyltransferase [Alphaproteobacteria bacterium]
MNKPLPTDIKPVVFINAYFEKTVFNFLFSFVAGAIAALAMPPSPIWGLLLISVPVLYYAVTKAKNRLVAFGSGWVFGFGYFVFSLSWVANALLVEGNPYVWAWPLAACGLPALLAFFPALACLIAKSFMRLNHISGWLGFVAAYALFEWVRGHIFTGFPWNLFGYTWVDSLPMIQVLRLSDVYFLTLLTLIWACAPALMLLQSSAQKISGLLIVTLTLLGTFAYGQAELSGAEQETTPLNIRVVQPNIAQHEKWERGKQYSNFEKHLNLSTQQPLPDEPIIVVWPETAVSYRLLQTAPAQILFRNALASLPVGSSLLTGYLRYDAETGQYFNSLVEFDRMGTIQNIYDKNHLVPFGEYIPFQQWIPLKPVVQFQGFGRGEGIVSLNSLQNKAYSPLVCYEIIFPGRATDTNNPPDFIVNVTNDAWYGDSAGPHQHLAKAVYRAVETGIPVIRSANTGISAIIDPYGRKNQSQSVFTKETINAKMPKIRGQSFIDDWAKNNIFMFLVFAFFSFALIKKHYNTNED